jgi:hypothetical protein
VIDRVGIEAAGSDRHGDAHRAVPGESARVWGERRNPRQSAVVGCRARAGHVAQGPTQALAAAAETPGLEREARAARTREREIRPLDDRTQILLVAFVLVL